MGRRTLLLITSILLAAVGTALIAVYVKGADSRAEKNPKLISVEVVKRPVLAGTPLSQAESATSFAPGLRRMADLPPGRYVSTEAGLSSIKSDAVASTNLLVGQVVQTDMFGSAGDSVASSIGIGKNEMAAQFQLSDPGRVAGTLQPGMNVMVFQLPAAGEATRLLPNVRVLKVGNDSTASSANTTTASTTSTADQVPQTLITFALTQKQETQMLTATENNSQLVLAVLPTGSAS